MTCNKAGSNKRKHENTLKFSILAAQLQLIT